MTALSLSPLGQQLLGDLPPYLADDPHTASLVDACARELERVNTSATGLREKLFPVNADDEFHTLGWWELLLGLPVEPSGTTVAARRATVLAHIRSRASGSGAHWQDLLTEALGSSPWTYTEGPAADTIVLHIPFASTSYTAGQIERLARAVTPAHLDVIISYSTGFLLGISLLGVEPL